MSFASQGARTTLTTAVATSGTFTIGYPTGFSRGDFVEGARHKAYVNQALIHHPADFGLTFNATNITVTWRRAASLPAGSTFQLELEIFGDSSIDAQQYVIAEPVGYGPTIQGATGRVPRSVNRIAPVELVAVRIKNPLASSAVSLRAAAALATTGSFAILSAGQVFDVPRNVIITSTGDATGTVFTVTGTDEYGQVVVENITGANAAVASGVKAFATITSISNNVAVAAGNISIGMGNVFGLPFWNPHVGSVLYTLQDNTAPANAPTHVAGLAANTVSTATTADVRGTFAPNTNAANVPDGSRTYTLVMAAGEPWHLGNPQFAG